MRGLTGRPGASTWYGPPERAEHRRAAGAEDAPDQTLRDPLERVDELQEERRQLQRLPAVPFGAADAAAALGVPAVPPSLQRRRVEIEAEIEQLRSEIEGEE